MPVFTGAFEIRNDATWLTGHFGLHRAAKVFLAVWLFVTILFYLGASYFAIAGSDPIGGKLFAFLIPTFFLVVGLAMIHLSTWASRNDVEYVSTKIGEAFRANGA